MNQKTRSLVTLLVLAGVGAGIGLYAWYGVHLAQEQEKEQKELSAKLFTFDKKTVKRIVVTAKGQTSTVVPGEGEQWKLVSPVTTPADKSTVDALVERMTQLKSKSMVEEKAQDLAKYGLASPKLKVTLQLEDGSELVFRAGDDNQFDNSVYVATADSSDVIQAEGNFKWALEKDAFDLRDKRVAPFEDADVTALKVRAGDRRYALKKVDGKWQLATGGAADETTVNRLLGTLRNLRATRFDTDTLGPADGERYGFQSPAAVVELTANGKLLEVTFGRTEADGVSKFWARRADATFAAEINETAINDLKVSDFDLQDKTVLAFDDAQVHGLKLTAGGETFVVERVKNDEGKPGDDWTFQGGGAVKKWKASSIVTALRNLKAAAFTEENATDLAKYGLASPAKSVTLLVGQENGSNLYVKTAASNRVLEVEKTRLSELPASRADLAEPPPAAKDGEGEAAAN